MAPMQRCRNVLGSLTGKLLGSDSLAELDEELQMEFAASEQEFRARNLKYIMMLGLAMTTYYLIVSGFKTELHTFTRVNNFVSVVLFFLVCLVRIGVRDGHLPLTARTQALDKVSTLVALTHYTCYTTLTWPRTQSLLKITMGVEADFVPDSLGEAYCVLYVVMAISICSSLHVVHTSGLLLLSIVAPCSWALQCATLGTNLDLQSWLQLAGVYSCFCAMAFIGGRSNNLNHLNSFLLLHMERLQVMRTFRQANVPIFIVDREQGASSDLKIDLWNNALEELTQASVPSGTKLSHVACLRSSSSVVLLNAIQRALGEEGRRTQRMLVPVVAKSGVVWLQVDTSPVIYNGKKKAIVIGSDVTEYVTRHMSLLHFVPEEGLGEQPRGKEKVGCCAELDPHALTVLDCTPGFNILMQQQMHGRPFLNYVSEENRKRFQKTVGAVLERNCSQKVTVSLCTENELDRHASRHRRRSKKSANPAVRKVNMEISLIREGNAEQGALQIQLLSERSGEEPPMKSSSSDPGTKCLCLTSPDNEMRCRSETSKSQCDKTESFSDLAKSEASGSHCSPIPEAPDGTILPKMEAVMIHLIDLVRRFNLESFEACIQLLEIAVQRLQAQREESVRRFGEPCRGWRCQLCRALNDEEDEVCEVCKLGEPTERKPDETDDEATRSELPPLVAPVASTGVVEL